MRGYSNPSINYFGLFPEFFGKRNYRSSIVELYVFCSFIRPLTDAIPFMVNHYANGENKEDFENSSLALINLCTMYLFNLTNLHYNVISSILDEENEVILTYEGKDIVYVQIKNQYTGLESSDLGEIPPMKPLRIPSRHLYDPEKLGPHSPENPSFFSVEEFLIMIDRQFEVFSEYISDIQGLSLELIKKYSRFIIEEVGDDPYKKFNNELFIKKIQDCCNASKTEAMQLQKLSCSNGSDALHSLFIEKPILSLNSELYLMPYAVPKWGILLLEEYAELNKSYLIQMGFIFENEIKNLMTQYGLHVIDVKRIKDKADSKYKNREFDVIVEFNEKIYDFQCKNYKFNYNPSPEEISTLKCNHNTVLRRVLAGLYNEEEKRELLEAKYQKEVVFYAISRFPIITKEEKIIIFKDLEKWLGKFTGNKKDITKSYKKVIKKK